MRANKAAMIKSDASDCSKKTSFEKKDYDATILGAHAGRADKECNSNRLLSLAPEIRP